MGKENLKVKARLQRHNPIHIQSSSIPRRNRIQDEQNLDKKILRIAKEQQEKIEKKAKDDEEDEERDKKRFPLGFEEEDLADVEEYNDYEELEINEDNRILNAFVPTTPKKPKTLANIIMEKLKDETREEDNELSPFMDPKVIQVYTSVGESLSRYKTGNKLPKAFKIIPSLKNWEEILYLTSPDTWSPHATYEITRMFITLKPKQLQQFYTYVLLHKFRRDIAENNKTSYHLYLSLKKAATAKPAAFFKGILFPLCESGTCNLKEAAILGSVLTKVFIPALHSSTALLHLVEMTDYTGPNSLFIRILLEKKHALPFKVVDALVMHYAGFMDDPRDMPQLWYQSLFVFVQRYKQDLVTEQKEIILEVVKIKYHPTITSEVRHELEGKTGNDIMMMD